MSEIHINIDESLKKIALEHTEERIKYEFDRFGLPEEKRRSMILIGSIGQLVFKKFLEKNNVKFEFEFQAGKYDKMDFKINGKIIEIKCSGFDEQYHYLNLLYAKDQLYNGLQKKFEYCVQIFINGYERSSKMLNVTKCVDGIISGYIEFIKIKNFENNYKKSFGDDYKVPLSNLKSINQLLEILK